METQSQLQAAAKLTITHEEIYLQTWIGRLSANKYSHLEDREFWRGCKVFLRAHYGVGWHDQVMGTSGERQGGISELKRYRRWIRRWRRWCKGHQHWFIQKLISGDRPGHRGSGSSPLLGLITQWQVTDPVEVKVVLIWVTLTTFTQTEPDLSSVHTVCGKC